MAVRVSWSSSVTGIYKSRLWKNPFSCHSILVPLSSNSLFHSTSLFDVISKVFNREHIIWASYERQRFHTPQRLWIHSSETSIAADKEVETELNFKNSIDGTLAADKEIGPKLKFENSADGTPANKVKRKKLKGKRAVVRWLKFFRWKKKKEYERMMPEEKILFKLKKARKKEEQYVVALKKLEPSESSETTHDPEILTPEEHFHFLKMGLKSKNYVPIGRRGIYQGVILNMHLHWKKHQTLQVIVKTFTVDEVKEIAAELARLSGGIVLDIHEKNTIIMYRGKNYAQPPTEIMSPRITLSRKKALDKSKYRDGLRAVRKYIPRLEQDMELLQAHAKNKGENKSDTDIDEKTLKTTGSDKLREMLMAQYGECLEDDELMTDLDAESESEALSDIFETDSDSGIEEKEENPLYLDEFEKFPVEVDGTQKEFAKNKHQLPAAKKSEFKKNHVDAEKQDTDSMPDFDEVDQLFLRATSLLKKRRR